jgi:Tol biopolymer transport system component
VLVLEGRISYSQAGEGWEESSAYIMDLKTGQTTRLGFGGCPSLSHDGTRVVYVSYDRQPMVTLLVDLGTGQRWEIDEEGIRGGFGCSRSAISWDNTRVAMDGVYVWRDANLRQLVAGGAPAWSPDDAWIVYYTDGWLYRIPSTGGPPVKLAESTWTSSPSWSIRNQIAFVRDEDIYVMNADGSSQTRLTDHPRWDRHPVWSPDGAMILFASDRQGRWQWYLMNADGSNVTHIPELDGYGSISWSQ